jgi:hypothetical protein
MTLFKLKQLPKEKSASLIDLLRSLDFDLDGLARRDHLDFGPGRSC